MNEKAVLLFSILLLFSVQVTSYDASGGSTSDEEPGNTDQFAYDLDAAFTFSGGVPDSTGPSAYYGATAVVNSNQSGTEEFPDEQDSGDSIKKYYIANEGDNRWGQGSVESTIIQVDDSIVRTNRNGIPYLVAPPHPEAGDSEHECGDAVFDSNNGIFSCPEDYGLPADKRYDAGPGSELSDTSLSDNFGSHTVTTNGEGRTEPVNYKMDLVAEEPWGEANLPGEPDHYVPDVTDVESDDTVSFPTDQSFNYPYDDGSYDLSWENVPDYYQGSDNSIRMVYPVTDGWRDWTTITNYYLEDTDTHDEWTGPSDTRYTCDGSGENATCGTTNPGDTICTSKFQNTYTDEVDTIQEIVYSGDGYDLERSIDTTRYETTKTGQYGYDTVTTTQTFYMDGIAMKPDDPDDLQYTDCSSTTTANEKDCDEEPGANGGTWCDFTSVSGPTEETNYHAEHHTADIKVEVQELRLVDTKIFDTDRAASSSSDIDGISDSREALFGGDNINGVNSPTDEITHLSEGNRGYYSHEIFHPTEDLINDKSISLSTFEIEPEDNNNGNDDSAEEFESVRDNFEVYDADGPYGESDGFIAIRHDVENEGQYNEQKSSSRQIVGTSNLFLQQESKGTESETNIDFANYVSTSDSPVPACPENHLRCVASVDVSLKNLQNWGSTDPSSGIQFETIGPYDTNQSMSACKMYQKIDGTTDYSLGDISNQQCSWESGSYVDDDDGNNNDDDDDGGGGQTCDTPGERWHMMEGPAVNEDTFNPAEEQAVSDDYESCVAHSQCVYKGSTVDEGYVANIADDNEVGYESGSDSPDWEVCLNIHHTGSYPDVDNGYHPEGAHEFGGQWYDLDDDRVDYYLRPSNDNGGNGGEDDYDGAGHRLISQATEEEQENPNHISYYYRRNPNPEHPEWNPRGYTGSGANKNYYYGFNIEDDCDQDLNGCDDSGVQTNFFYSFIWENQGMSVEDYDHVRSPPVS